ncbi:MAG: DedA family protein [Cyanothece sp. SIO1E1]|nr:DedA family protein [Cyanothece sp. SIO1E1]
MSLEFLSLESIQDFSADYGYWAVFFGILLENIGIPIPGETITLVGGFLAGSGELDYWYVLGSAIAGATLGSNLGYLVGVYGGWPLLVNLGRLLRIQDEKLEASRHKFSQNAAKAVFFGRFIVLLRMLAAPLAGVAQMPYKDFLFWNVLGATAWALTMVTLSFFVGQLVPLEQLVAWVAEFATGALILVIIWVTLATWLESRQREAAQQDSST